MEVFESFICRHPILYSEHSCMHKGFISLLNIPLKQGVVYCISNLIRIALKCLCKVIFCPFYGWLVVEEKIFICLVCRGMNESQQSSLNYRNGISCIVIQTNLCLQFNSFSKAADTDSSISREIIS